MEVGHLAAGAAAVVVGSLHALRSSKATPPRVLCQATPSNLATVTKEGLVPYNDSSAMNRTCGQSNEVTLRHAPQVLALRSHLEPELWPSWLASGGGDASTAVGFGRLTPRFQWDERQVGRLALWQSP